VSRLAIIRQFRRRKGEETAPASLQESDYQGGPIARFPYVLAALYLAVVAAAERERLETLYLLTEPRMARHLRAVGIPMTPIGKEVDHRGIRVPSRIDVQAMIAGLKRAARPLYALVREEIETASRLTTD
jgi:N-acyl amino acid synthase of PEP-CTERM/exosortase system